MVEKPICREQLAYHERKLAETALAEVVTKIKKGIKCGFALSFLLDIEGEFNHTSMESISQGAREHEVSDTVVRCKRRLMNSRMVVE